ncbi:hypothetical protein DH2020_004619 [Rehmannia glutinosa]|uniref:RRM domain-containing protein n=1 Tax=Rehmannia glutinosa TaxID=99300 RepID=A0ABR0XPV7_REHGL
MTTSHSQKEKSGSSNQVSQDDLLEGTSARTRPVSFHDIMLRRKNKGDAVKLVAIGSEVADIALARDNIEKTSDIPEYHMQINEDSERMDTRRTSNDSVKVNSRRKGDNNDPKKNGKLVEDKDEGSRNLDAKSKGRGDKTGSSKIVTGENERHHSNRRKDGHLSVDSYNGSNKKQARDSYREDKIPERSRGKISERSRGKSEVDRKQLPDEDRQVYRKRKTEGRMSSDSEKEYKKRNARDVMQTEKITNRGRAKPEKESRHKRHNEEDKTKSRTTDKKNDSERKGPEPIRASLEESRPKRRRSRSRERDKGRDRKSHSPRAHKHTSKDKREHGEQSSHSTKDRSGRDHSDVKRLSNNGSSSHYRRDTVSSSGLGGYSPRKRKTDAAAKTPSPTRRSPEKKNAGWDLQPVENESIMASSTLPNLQPTSQNFSLNIKEFPSVTPVTPTVVRPVVIAHQTITSQMHAIESVQLTQATRPMRRLYVENLPPSASEKDLIECINKFLLSSGVNYIQGTQPCISCIIHKEKSQALLEFLTPEDASAALFLDGMSFCGSNLKLRRPKDYANVTAIKKLERISPDVILLTTGFQTVAIFMQTGLSDKSVVAVDSISDVVEDSPHKIFIGGISKLISSKVLLEIARAFGPVKAFRFEFIADINEPCAYLEYVDHSVTSKACAGLNGMRLGGRVVTAVFATPEAVLENAGKLPFYEIPEHAKPLLENPTAVVKLKNMLDPEGLLSLSESELEDILEDIRLECSRFGTVKSINVAKPTNSVGNMEAYEVKNTSASTDAYNLEFANRRCITEQLGDRINGVGELDRLEPTETLNGVETNSQTVEDNNGSDDKDDVEPDDLNRSRVVGDSSLDEMIAGNLMKDEIFRPPSNDENISVKESSSPENTVELANKQNASVIKLESNDNIAGSISERNTDMENKPLIEGDLQSEERNAKTESSEEKLNLEENNANIASSVELVSDERKELDAREEGDKKDISIDLENVFEPGSVFVEYRRAEAACMAAHCLHGRIFDGRVVMAGYVGLDLYQMRFRK